MFSDVPSTDYSASETPASSDGPVTVEQSQQVEGKGFNAQDMAKKVFRFVAAAEELANGVRDSEEVKLLRLRTKNHEMVIVPGPSSSEASQQLLYQANVILLTFSQMLYTFLWSCMMHHEYRSSSAFNRSSKPFRSIAFSGHILYRIGLIFSRCEEWQTSS